jgi:hypothetical protein
MYVFSMELMRNGQNCPVGIAMLICTVALRASDEPPISVPHVSLISRQPIIVSV